MTSRVREIFDFAQMEPESADDVREMIGHCDPDELQMIDRIAGNLANGVRSVKARRRIEREKTKNAEDFCVRANPDHP